MRRYLVILLIAVAASAGCRTITPQQRAETAVKHWQGYVLQYNGADYHPIDFGDASPVFGSNADSTILGWTIDHRFATKRDPSDREISRKRYYLDKNFSIVYASPNFPELGSPAKDSIGYGAIRGDIRDPFGSK